MFGPARSPTKAPYRAPTKSLALEVEVPTPPPDTNFWPCHGQAISLFECTPNPCDFNQVDCESKLSSPRAWTVNYSFQWLVGNLNYKNLPMTVENQSGQVLATLDYGCGETGWVIWDTPTNIDSGYYTALQDVRYDPYRFISPPPPGGFGEQCDCSVNSDSPPIAVLDELISFRTQRATWRIESIVGNTVNVNPADGPLLLWDKSMLILKDTPGGINDLPVRVNMPIGGAEFSFTGVVNDDGGDPGLTDQGPGGILEFLVGDWYSCQPYTTLEAVPFNIYPAKLVSSVPIFEQDRVAILRLSNAGVYSGDYIGCVYESTGTVVLPVNWIGDQESGIWQNKYIRLTVPGTGITSTTTASVQGVGALYDGIQELIPASADAVDIADTWFIGGDSGKIVFPDSYGEGTGIDENTFEPITIQVSGTTSYDGTYFCLVLRDIGEPLATFIGGDFNNLYKEPTEAGSWVEVGGTGRSGTITIMPINAAEDFTAVNPQLSATIERIFPDAFRVNVANPEASVDDWARLFDYQSGGISAQSQWHVRAVGAGYVDLEGLLPDSYNPNGNITFSRRRS